MYRIHDEETVELLDGPYAGTKYRYGGVRFDPDYAADHMTVSFECYIIEEPVEIEDLEKFHNYIGDILMELIDDQMKAGTLVYRSDVKTGVPSALRDEDHFHPSLL